MQKAPEPYTDLADEVEGLRARIAQLEQALAQPHYDLRYRTLADAMPQLVWATDTNGAHFYFNRRWYEYTGLSEAESLGFGFANALHPDDVERTLNQWQRAWRNGESYEIEYRFRRFDGTYHWFIGRALPVLDSSGKILEWVGTCTNIDDQKRAAETERFLAEASTLLASSLDYELTLIRVAELAVPRIADWCAVDIAAQDGKVRRLATAHIDPSKVALARELVERYPYDPNATSGVAQVLRTGEPEFTPVVTPEMIQAVPEPELRAVLQDLGLRSAMVVPLSAHGRRLGAITLVLAETERHYTAADLDLAMDIANRAAVAVDHAQLHEVLRNSEQRLRNLADAMPLVVWTARPDGSVDYFNQSWFEYTGMSYEEAMEWGWSAVLHPDDYRRCLDQWSHSVKTGQPYEVEYRWKRDDNVYRWHLGRSLAVRDENDQIAYWVGTGTDIDDQKRIEQRLRDQTEELAQTTRALEIRNNELDQFAYVTSHDLKAPLRGISHLSQWIEEDLGEHASGEIRANLELLRGRVQRMENMIDGILQYSRVGRVARAITEVDVGELLAEVIDLLSPPPEVTIEVAPDMPIIATERLPLEQVFQNLIGNAIKHARRPDVLIKISARQQNAFYQFAVSDNGPGIAPQYHDRIFGIFQTLAPRDQVEGSGLGLALIKKIVEHRRGRVWLESAEGQGSTFFFTWPRGLRE